MPTVHQLSQPEARRVAVRAQMLTSRRPPDLLTLVRRLTMLQLDPVSAVAPSADLVAWSRLGAAYHPDDLKAAIAGQSVIELRAFLRPAEDFALYRSDMATWPGPGELQDWQVFNRDWVAANDRCRRDILARLAAGGWPLADVRSLAGFRRRFQCGAARAGCEGRLSCPPSSGRPGRRRRCRGLGSNHSAPCAGTAGGSPRRSRTRRPGRSRW